MPNAPAATRGNLLALRKSRALAQNGYDLLYRKQTILMREMLRMMDLADGLRHRVRTTFTDAYRALERANISDGLVYDLAQTFPVEDTLGVTVRSVMGVELPTVTLADKAAPPALHYGLHNTHAMLDAACQAARDVKHLCASLAEIENSIYRLSVEIKKTRSRANALRNIVLPRYDAQIAVILSVLEEREREDFSRIKAGFGDGGVFSSSALGD